jgi:uncharacterized protein (DUF885 family)
MSTKTSLRRVQIVCTIVSIFAVCTTAAEAPPADQSVKPMRQAVEGYVASRAALDRKYEIPTADAARQRLAAFFADELRRLNGTDFDALDQAGKIDYLLLASKLRFESRELDHQQKQIAEARPLVPFAGAIVSLEQSRRKMERLDAEQAAKTLNEILRQITAVHHELEGKAKSGETSAGAPSKIVANRAAHLVDDLHDTLKHWYRFYADYDPEFTWWAKEPYPKVDKELDGYAKFLRSKFVGYVEGEEEPVIGDPIGRDALLDALAVEMIPYTPEELLDIADKEFAWCEVEMKRAARDLGCGEDWHKALEKVTADHVKPGDQPALIKELADEATKFVEDRDLVTIPPLCKETWRMEMMTPKRQKVNPYFLGGEEIQVSYPTDGMSYEDKLMSMRGNNRSFCRATVFHELIPGHHLQGFIARRYNAHRRAFSTPFYIEGWALYWEMRMWELGFPRNAEDRVGMLFWRAHRCARIIFSIKFHLGQMTAPQAIDFLVERVGHERRNATAEVRRSVSGEYGPLYQAAYMLGALQLRALRTEVVGAAKMTDKQFNDAVLRENTIPIEMIRADLTGQKLTRDFKSSWRFYEELKPQPHTTASAQEGGK